MCVKTQSSYGKEVSKPAKAQTTSVTRIRIEFFQWLYWTYRIPDPIPPSALTQAEGVFSLPERDRVQVEHSGSGMRKALPQSIIAQKHKRCYLRTFDFTDLTLAKFEVNLKQNSRFRNLHIIYVHTQTHTYIIIVCYLDEKFQQIRR